MSGATHEFGFELRVCRWAERAWPPDGSGGQSGGARPVVVARQLGTRRRRWDTVVVESSPAGLDARAAFGEEALDSDLLHVVRNAPRAWAWYRDALPDPGYPWRYVRAAVHRAGERGLVDTRKRGGRVELRRKWRYPDWIERVVAVENKPDLAASAARALAAQVERDVALGLADEVWVATRATGAGVEPAPSDGAGVEPALLERLPVEAGILAVDPTDTADGSAGGTADGNATAEVVWHPRTLAVDEPGTRILDRPTGGDGGQGTHDRSAARFEYADPAWKAAKRLEIAERAYGRGWRSYHETMRPDCRHFRLRDLDFPYCAAKERGPRAAECAGSCPQFEPEPPTWRQRGWPIEGGPGKGAKRLLDRRRSRRR